MAVAPREFLEEATDLPVIEAPSAVEYGQASVLGTDAPPPRAQTRTWSNYDEMRRYGKAQIAYDEYAGVWYRWVVRGQGEQGHVWKGGRLYHRKRSLRRAVALSRAEAQARMNELPQANPSDPESVYERGCDYWDTKTGWWRLGLKREREDPQNLGNDVKRGKEALEEADPAETAIAREALARKAQIAALQPSSVAPTVAEDDDAPPVAAPRRGRPPRMEGDT